MRSSAGPRTTALCAVLAVFALLVSACGGSNAQATDKPSTDTSATASPTPTPTPLPSPTPSQAPLSPFEDRAPVKAVRAFAVAAAQAINDRDRSLAAVVPLTTAQGLSQTRDYYTREDMDHGYLEPGPEPFTPVKVAVRGAIARLDVCMQTRGWSLGRKTGKPVERYAVVPVVIEMRKVAGAWKFDRFYAGTGDCAHVRVQGVRW